MFASINQSHNTYNSLIISYMAITVVSDPQLCVFHYVAMEIALSLMSVNVTLDGPESSV